MDKSLFKKLKIGIGIIISIILIGIVGYRILEGWSLFDSFYMTVITISTTGFKELHPLSKSGMILTVFLIIFGVLAIAYTGGRGVQILFETQLLRRRRMNKKLEQLSNHNIVCGYGRMGRQICESLYHHNEPFVVIDKNFEFFDKINEHDYIFIKGDATHDDVLLKAGIKKAKGLIAVIGSDPENVFATLAAKELNKNIFIVARAIEEGTKSKLKIAGADRIVMPYELGSSRMVQLLLRPAVSDFVEGVVRNKDVDISLEEIIVRENSKLAGLTLAESPLRRELNIIVIAIDKSNKNFEYNPKSSTIIEAGDKLIAIGHADDLNKLTTYCNINTEN